MNQPPQSLYTLSTVACVVKVTGERRAIYAFIGWRPDDKPFVTNNIAALTREARDSIAAYKASRLPFREVPYRVFNPIEFDTVAAAIDYPDGPKGYAEDLVKVEFVGPTGQNFTLPIGELALLNAIADAAQPWQLITAVGGSQVAVTPRPMYTLFIPMSASEAYAVLFKPAIPGESNEAPFKAFVRNVISKLLVIDESQEPNRQKGYIQAAATLGEPEGKGLLSQLIALDEAQRMAVARAGHKARAGLLRTLRALSLIDISDAQLEVIEHNADAYYDIEALSLTQLLHLAGHMAAAARKALR